MSEKARYSYIACPACGKSFKFWDDFQDVPSGKVLKCPKCRCMFACRVIDQSTPEDISYTADVNDSEAQDKFMQRMQELLQPSKNEDESSEPHTEALIETTVPTEEENNK